MKIFKVGQIILAIGGLLVAQFVMPAPVQAGATLSFSPSSKTLNVGQSWSVNVMVNADQQINSGTIKVTYNATRLKATNIGCGADFSTPIAPSIANGSANISCARFSPHTGVGHFATVTFQAISAGASSLGFGVSTIVANDGMGTNVYTGGGSANVTVTAPSNSAPPPPASQPQNNNNPQPTQAPVVNQTPTSTAMPVISSTTHSDQNKWYKERNIEITWTKTGTEFNYAIDQSPATQLPQQAKDGATNYSQTVSGDGTWYAHVRANGDKGWSNTAHYKIQIDSTAPTPPVITTEPASPMKILPTISFKSDDSGSGIDFYQIKLANDEWQKVESPYKPQQMTSGDHSIQVRAVDRAGNSAESTTKFTIVPLAVPQIDSITQNLLLLGESFTVSGTAPKDTKVEIYLNGEKKETVEVDKDGRYTSKEEYLLFPGAYDITVKAVNVDGITSPMSEPKTVVIDAKAVSVMGLVLPGWGVFGLGGLTIVILLLGLLWLAYKLWTQTRTWAGKLSMVGNNLDNDFAQLEKNLAAAVDETIGSKDPQAAEAIKADIAEQIDKVEDELDDELKNVGSLDYTVISKNNTPWFKAIPSQILTAIVAGAASVKQLAGNIKPVATSKPKTKSEVENAEPKTEVEEKAKDNSKEPGEQVPASAEQTLAELESKAKGENNSASKSETEPEHNAIPEIGDILAPEKN